MKTKVVVLLIASILFWTGCGKNPEDAKKNLQETAKKMGAADLMYAEIAINTVENCLKSGSSIPWKSFDDNMLKATPETQQAYYEYRNAVINTKK